MPDKTKEQEKEKTLENVERQGEIADSQLKLNRTHIDVEMPRRMRAIRELEELLTIFKKGSEKDKNPEKEVTRVEQELEKERNDTIKATLVPLKVSEILAIQGFVRDADITASESRLALDVRLFMCLKAEQCAMIWFTMRKRANHYDRYFRNQEDVALMDELTLIELSKIYKNTFVLSEESRKNL